MPADRDWMSEAQALAAEAGARAQHRGWDHVPRWLRWWLAINGTVFLGAVAWGLAGTFHLL